MPISASRDSIHPTDRIQKAQRTAYPKQIETTEEPPRLRSDQKEKYPSGHPKQKSEREPLRARERIGPTNQGEKQWKIKRNISQASARGPAEYSTGAVRIDQPFQGTDPVRVSGAIVTFEPGARATWHTHPLGQALIVTFGVGWAQREGSPVEDIRPGDVIWFSAGKSTGMEPRQAQR
jgi:quercetin dioxygenase-like cupin family protein